MKDCLIVFAKEPEVGKVKTRLEGYLSKEQCVALYKAFLKDTLAMVKAVSRTDVVVAYQSIAASPGYLQRIGKEFIFYKQKGKDLGARMHKAFQFAEKMNYRKTVIVGTDSPNLPPQYINEAFRKLDKNDVVLGPSFDGGYYLVGLKESCIGMWKRIQWSKAAVLENTVRNAKSLNKKVYLLKRWYDIDDPSGLIRLRQDLKVNIKSAPWTRKLLKI